MTNPQERKKELVKMYREKLKDSTTILIVKPVGVTVNQSTQLKKDLYALDSNYNIVKNTLFKIALQEEGLPELDYLSSGEHAVIFTNDQVSEAAKIISAFAKETKNKVEIQGGLLDGEAISGEQVVSLANLPSKDQLIGQLLSVMNGPARNFVIVLQGNVREMVYVLNAIAEAKQ